MKPVRALAHALLSATFISGAASTLVRPGPAAERAKWLSERLTARLGGIAPWLPTGPAAVARANAAVQLGAAVLLASGRAPRLAAAVLAGSLVPGTVARHPFRRTADPTERGDQTQRFLTDLGLLGGLVLVMVDTQGRPGLRWRAEKAAGRAARRIRDLPHTAG